MSQTQSVSGSRPRSDADEEASISIITLGLSFSVFFASTYSICIVGYLLLPGLPVQHAALSIFLPGFDLLSWRSFFLGLVESFIWGWYIAVVFGLYTTSSAATQRAE